MGFSTRSLTLEEFTHQQKRLAELKLPHDRQKIINTSPEKIRDLLSLADVTRSRGNETIYGFTIPRAGDDGSDGTLSLRVEGDLVTETWFIAAEG